VHYKHVNKKSHKQVKNNERKARRERRRKAKKRNTFYHKESVNYNTIYWGHPMITFPQKMFFLNTEKKNSSEDEGDCRCLGS
jgi:hypothetical protein